MGTIRDGSVSGTIPEDEVFAVHYPGYPSSSSRAVETLGGYEGILKARSSFTNYLELRFRPEDPCSHPAFGERRHCNGLLLKLSRKKFSNGKTASCAKDISEHLDSKRMDVEKVNETRNHGDRSPTKAECVIGNADKHVMQDESVASSQLSADVVARVTTAYHFEGMVDYQHVLAVHADVAREKKRHWVQPQFDMGGLMDMDQDVMMLVPPLFSLKDIPENLVLRAVGFENSKRKQGRIVQYKWEMDIAPCLALEFNIKEIPGAIDFVGKIPRYSVDWDWQLTLINFFNERPIWPKCSLHSHFLEKGVQISHVQLKRLLFRSAYYFANGPFRALWIRKGYDPRKDPESRIYQRIEFRVPKEMRNVKHVSTDREKIQTWKDLCAFRVFPCKSFSSLQLCELDDDYIQQEIRRPTKQTSCKRSTGWFSQSRFNRLQLSVSVRFLSLHSSPEAENLLKLASKRLESYKRLQAQGGGVSSEEEDLQLADGGEKLMNSNNMSAEKGGLGDEVVREDDEGYEEGEEEEEEEEEDAYGPLEISGGYKDAFSLQYPYTGEAVGRAYLQQLFGGFPFASGSEDHENRTQHLGTSDHEYEIYEQDSDDGDDN